MMSASGLSARPKRGLAEKLKPPWGTRVMDSTPPQMKTSPAPMAIWPAAMWIADMDEPQNRFTVMPPTSMGRPASSKARRAMLFPCSASG